MTPVKHGYKVWAGADSATGYMCDFKVDTGKDGTYNGTMRRSRCQSSQTSSQGKRVL